MIILRLQNTHEFVNSTSKRRTLKFPMVSTKKKTRVKNAIPSFKKAKPKQPTRRSPRKRTSEPMEIPDVNSPEPESQKELSGLELLQKQIADLNAQNESLKNEVKILKNEIQELKGRTYRFENISKIEKLFKSETGLELDCFEILFESLNPGEQCENVKMYDSKQKSEQNNEADVLQSPTTSKSYQYIGKPGPAVKLDAKNQLFLYMTWLKGALASTTYLGYLIYQSQQYLDILSPGQISCIFLLPRYQFGLRRRL